MIIGNILHLYINKPELPNLHGHFILYPDDPLSFMLSSTFLIFFSCSILYLLLAVETIKLLGEQTGVFRYAAKILIFFLLLRKGLLLCSFSCPLFPNCVQYNSVLKRLKTISRPIVSVSHCCCSKLAVNLQ